jgi:excisionase family DNA binding protein
MRRQAYSANDELVSRSSSDRARRRTASDIPKFFTTLQVAELLEVSHRTVRRWIGRGNLAAHRIGKVVRISDADLQTFLARSRDPE